MRLVVEIHHHHHEHSVAQLHLLAIRRELNVISQEIQDVLDRARQEHDLVKAIDLRQTAMMKQISDLLGQVKALPTGTALSDEDKAALVEAATDLDESISTLTADTTANVPLQTDAPPAVGDGTETQPVPQGQPINPDEPQADTGHAADAAAAAAAKPL